MNVTGRECKVSSNQKYRDELSECLGPWEKIEIMTENSLTIREITKKYALLLFSDCIIAAIMIWATEHGENTSQILAAI